MKRYIKQVIISVGIVLVIAVVTVLALNFFNITNQATQTTSTTKTARAIVDEFENLTKTGNLAEGVTVSTVADQSSENIFVKDNQTNVHIGVKTKKVAILTSSEGYSDSQLSETIKVFEDFLKTNGLSASPSINDKNILLSYSLEETICQLKKLQTEAEPIIQLHALCVDSTDYESLFNTVRELISLWNPSSTTQYDRIIVNSLSDDVYTVTVLLALKADATTSYTPVFVNSSNTWSFITDASKESTSPSIDGKDVPNDELQTALNNPNYGPLLKKYFL